MTGTALATTQGTGLALEPGQEWWNERQKKGLEQLGLADASQGDLLVFMHVAQKTGLDPFARQIHMIGRNVKNQRTQQWEIRYTIQTGIDGYRLVADRADRRDGTTRDYEDTQWCDADGNWSDVWTKSTAPTAARVVLHRDGRRFSGTALYREFVQTTKSGDANSMWSKMPANQLAKCAEALALRKAYPQDLSGIYTDEEMDQADRPERREQPAAVGGSARQRMATVLGGTEGGEPAPETDPASEPNEAADEPDDVVDADIVEEPADAQPPESPLLDMRSQLAKKLFAVMNEAGITDDRQHEFLSKSLSREITSRKQLTETDARTVIDALEEAMTEPFPQDGE